MNFILQRLRRHEFSVVNHSLGCFSDCAEHRGLCWCDMDVSLLVLLCYPLICSRWVLNLLLLSFKSTHSLSALASSHLLGNMSGNKSKGLPAARLEGRHVTMKDEEAVCQRCATQLHFFNTLLATLSSAFEPGAFR